MSAEHSMFKLAKKIARKFGMNIERIRYNAHQSLSAIELKPKGAARGSVLFSYVIDPFLNDSVSDDHTNYWESICIAQTFLDRNYTVDIISYNNYRYVPQKSYDIFIGARTNFNHIVRHLNANCTKVVHLDTCHWLSNNLAATQRLINLRDRRGVSISNPKMIEAGQAIEVADHATALGNQHTISTYGFANKPIYRIPISSPTSYDETNRDFDQCRNRFIWFGSKGFVHKGLDLVIEAFARMPDKHLSICGPIEEEPDFVAIYRHELYKLANIDLIGWVDVNSDKFRNILKNSLGLVYPSCAEGGGGCVLTCMHGGLIPIVTQESSVDINSDYGVLLNEASIDEIINAVSDLSDKPNNDLKKMSENARTFALKNHTRESFAVAYGKYADETLLAGNQ